MAAGDESTQGAPGVGPLSAVVDAVVGARRLAGWALWVELAAIARLITVWKGRPPILDERLGPDPCGQADPGLAERLQQVVWELELSFRPWGSPPVDTAQFAEEFVLSEIAAATGLSFRRTRQRVDAATALFLTDRLPRTAALLRAGLVDETKLSTLLAGTSGLDEQTCRVVEARVISDGDLAVAAADSLDVHADPGDPRSRPGAVLPSVTRMTNPALQRALAAQVLAVDAEAAARRAATAREQRCVTATALPDGMGRLEIDTGQEVIAAILGDLDTQVATAKAAGDPRRPDQIRCDELVHRITLGAFGTPAVSTPAAPDAAPGRSGRRGRYGRRGLTVGLTMPLSTWLDLTDDPGQIDGHGPIAAALARQIATDAARDHPTTTTWRCVVIHDQHRTVLGVGDLLPTPRHDPPPRLARLVTTAEPKCVYPGCPAAAWRCDLDHRIPHEQGGPTCACNLQPVCRRHHRLKGTGLIQVRPLSPGEDSTCPPGTLEWTSWTGRSYRHEPPEAATAPVHPADQARAAEAALADAGRRLAEDLSEPADPDDPAESDDPGHGVSRVTHEWQHSLRKVHEQQRIEQQRIEQRSRFPAPTPDDDRPPF